MPVPSDANVTLSEASESVWVRMLTCFFVSPSFFTQPALACACLRARVHVYLVQSCRAIIFRPHHFLLNCRKSDYFFKIIQLLASSLISFWFLGLIKDFQQKSVGFQVFLQSYISSLSSGGWLEVDEGWQRQGTQITIILYCFCATTILYC